MSSVYLVAEGGVGTGARHHRQRFARVYVTNPVKLKTGAYLDADKKDIAIRALVPDMCTDRHRRTCEGLQRACKMGSDGVAGDRVRFRHQEPAGSRHPQRLL